MSSPDNVEDAYALLVRPIRKLLSRRGFDEATLPQKEAIPKILNGMNVLLVAPTGTGKTEAAILPLLSMFLSQGDKPPGIKILYITPLRALNRDLLERLAWWCNELDVRIAVRHGDTDQKERMAQSRSPPDFLITTPETLQAILPGRNLRRHLMSVQWVVVDEVHEFSDDKRGSQLSLALERLRWNSGREFQVIGLSATIGSPEKVASFLVGTDRSYEIVNVPVSRFIDLDVLYLSPKPEDYSLAEKLYTHPEVAARLRMIKQLIDTHRSVLLFTNTRAMAETLASRFRIWDLDFPVGIHHGSLAKPSRIVAERDFKAGELKGLVCTSSLELGIDVGTIDLCIQYMSPRQVTRLVQRVGRSGHRIGRTAKGIILTLDSDDTLEALVIARRALNDLLEPVGVPEKPLDTLTHQIVGLFTMKRQWSFDEVLKLYNQAYPYRDLDEDEMISVLNYMHNRYPRLAWVSFEEELAVRPKDRKDMYQYYYDNLSMIPDEKRYLVVDETNDSPVGVLDEVFVAEYSDPGTRFVTRGSVWKVTTLHGDKLYVTPIEDPTGAIPSWIGEQIPVPFEVAIEVGKLRRAVEDGLRNRIAVKKIANVIADQYPGNQETVLGAIKETVEQIRQDFPVPTDKKVIAEIWREYVILHASFGTKVNRTLAQLLGHLLAEEMNESVSVQEDPYRIIIKTQRVVKSKQVHSLIQSLLQLNIKEVLIGIVIETRMFKRRMIHVARKFGAVSKWADFGSISLNQLSKVFSDTAIFDESIKVTFHKDLDIDHTLHIIDDLREGEVEFQVIETGKEASPITHLGLERISMRSNIIPPETMKKVIIESAKARLLNEALTFICTKCWKHVATIQIKNLPVAFDCRMCADSMIGMLKSSEEDVKKLILDSPRSRSAEAVRLRSIAKRTAQLFSTYGKAASVAFAGKNLDLETVESILLDEGTVSDRLFELIVDEERKALSRRF